MIMSEPQEQRKPTWKRVVKIVVIVLIVLLLVLLAAASVVFIYVDRMMDKMNYVTGDSTVSPEVASSIDEEEWITIDPNDTTPTVDISDITIPTAPSEPADQGDHVVNIMLVGQDARPGEPPQRSDSMILVTFNKSTGEIMLTSFLRDQYVDIPGYGKTKLCHAYSYGGMTLLNQTISNHYGVEIDGNVTIGLEGFKEIIDMLGGVELYLTEKETKAINAVSDGTWAIPMKDGVQRLNGVQALRFSRLRHIDSDFQRTDRQRRVILALIEAYKDKTLPEMMAILEEVMPLITTNIPKDMIYWYAWTLFPMLSNSTVGSQRLPASGTFNAGLIKVSEGYMASCQYNIDFEANRRILEKLFDEIP